MLIRSRCKNLLITASREKLPINQSCVHFMNESIEPNFGLKLDFNQI